MVNLMLSICALQIRINPRNGDPHVIDLCASEEDDTSREGSIQRNGNSRIIDLCTSDEDYDIDDVN